MDLQAARSFLEEQAGPGGSENIAFRCEASKRLEEAGDYLSASEVLGRRWRGAGARPDVSGLRPKDSALLLQQSGMLSHRIATTQAREGAQDEAKDLLSEAARMFASLRDPGREAEALVGVGLCCWRQSALDEARLIISEALSRVGDSDLSVRAAALLAFACVEWEAGNADTASGLLREGAPLAEEHGSHRLKAGYHCAAALARRRAGDLDAALIEDAAASYHLERAGDMRQSAALENNIGFHLAEARQFDQAHEHYDRAHRLFTRSGDVVQAAKVDDSRAQALLAEGRPDEAEKYAERAAAALENADEKAAYVESLLTLGTARARRGEGPDAWAAFERARAVALNHISSEAGERVYEVLLDEVGPVLFNGPAYFDAYRRLQRSLIKKALVESDWSITKAAFKLGLKQQGLSQLLKGTHRDVMDERPLR